MSSRYPCFEDDLIARDAVGKVLDMLTERERKVLSWTYGLEDSPVYTQREIGYRLGLTESYAGQIRRDALCLMRDLHLAKFLPLPHR